MALDDAQVDPLLTPDRNPLASFGAVARTASTSPHERSQVPRAYKSRARTNRSSRGNRTRG